MNQSRINKIEKLDHEVLEVSMKGDYVTAREFVRLEDKFNQLIDALQDEPKCNHDWSIDGPSKTLSTVSKEPFYNVHCVRCGKSLVKDDGNKGNDPALYYQWGENDGYRKGYQQAIEDAIALAPERSNFVDVTKIKRLQEK